MAVKHSTKTSQPLLPFKKWRKAELCRIPLEGTTVGYWSVLECVGRERKHRNYVYRCRCKCGTERLLAARNLRPKKSKNGKSGSQSCGCLTRERRGKGLKSGMFVNGLRPRAWTCWNSMRRRCREQLSYIRAGITVCPQWSVLGGEGFQQFIRDMGQCPSDKHTIERIDGTKGYGPDNCRWATNKEQSRNRCNTRFLSFRGETKCVVDWATDLGMSEKTIYERLKKNLPIEEVLKPRKSHGYGFEGAPLDIEPLT